MKKKILFVPFVIIIVASLDILNRVFCTYAFEHVPEGSRVYYQHIYHLNQSKADIVVAGASNGMHSYLPSMISDSLGQTCFNSSQDGRNISYQYFCLKRANEVHRLKTFILDLGEFQLTEDWRDRTEYYKTYYWQNYDAKEYIDNVCKFSESVKMYSSFLQYNNKLLVAASTFLPLGKLSEDGYVPLDFTGVPVVFDKSKYKDNFMPDNVLVGYLDKVVEYCKSNNIRLIISVAPRLSYSQKFINYITDYCSDNNVELYNCVNTIDDKSFYRDAVHLNDKGARFFTGNVIQYLKE